MTDADLRHEINLINAPVEATENQAQTILREQHAAQRRVLAFRANLEQRRKEAAAPAPALKPWVTKAQVSAAIRAWAAAPVADDDHQAMRLALEAAAVA